MSPKQFVGQSQVPVEEVEYAASHISALADRNWVTALRATEIDDPDTGMLMAIGHQAPPEGRDSWRRIAGRQATMNRSHREHRGKLSAQCVGLVGFAKPQVLKPGCESAGNSTDAY